MTLGQAVPLSRLAVRTADVDEFRNVVVGLLRPFKLTARAGPYDARLRHSRVASFGLTTIEYGGEIEIAADALERFYLVQLALDGAYLARSLGEEIEFSGDRAQVLNPFGPIAMRWNAACRQLVIRFDKATVADYASALTGGRARGAPVFGESFSLATPSGARFRHLVGHLLSACEKGDGAVGAPLATRQAEQMLFAQLLAATHHDLPYEAGPWPGVPYYVKRAEEFISANVAEDIGLVDIVASAGVSMRTLYYGFRRCRGVGPMSWLRMLRLDRAREDLRQGPPEALTVTEVATRWGFFHLGKFAAAYRARFGETPSETLRRLE